MSDLVYTVVVGDRKCGQRMLEGMLHTLREVGQHAGDVYVICDRDIPAMYGAIPVRLDEPCTSYVGACHLRLEAEELGVPLSSADRVSYLDSDILVCRPLGNWLCHSRADRPTCVHERFPIAGNHMSGLGFNDVDRALVSQRWSTNTGQMMWPGKRTSCLFGKWRAAYDDLPDGPGREQSAFNRCVVRREVVPHYVPDGTVGIYSERYRWWPREDAKRIGRMVLAHFSGWIQDKECVMPAWEAAYRMVLRGDVAELEALL